MLHNFYKVRNHCSMELHLCVYLILIEIVIVKVPSMCGEGKICVPTNTFQKKGKKLRINTFCIISPLKMSELYKYISTRIMRLNAFQNAFIHIYMQLYTFVPFYKVLDARILALYCIVPLLLLTKTL